jgi:hypothetical protein
MRILPFMLTIFVVTAGIGTSAQAQNYPWCADYAGFGSQNCGFTTFQQCLAALSGNGGLPIRNMFPRPSRGRESALVIDKGVENLVPRKRGASRSPAEHLSAA